MQVGEPGQRPALREERGLGLEHAGPGVLCPVACTSPDDVDAPVLRVPRLVAQRLEGDPHLHLVAVTPSAGRFDSYTKSGLRSTA